MKFEEIYKKTKYAFEHDEVFELLTGQQGYSYLAPKVPVSVPTLIEHVYREGIFPYYRAVAIEEQSVLVSKLSNAFRHMIRSSNETTLWWGFIVLSSQKDYECYYKISPFTIADDFWTELSMALLQNKEKLSANKSFLGGGHADGLWGDVARINRLLIADYGIDVLNGGADGRE